MKDWLQYISQHPITRRLLLTYDINRNPHLHENKKEKIQVIYEPNEDTQDEINKLTRRLHIIYNSRVATLEDELTEQQQLTAHLAEENNRIKQVAAGHIEDTITTGLYWATEALNNGGITISNQGRIEAISPDLSNRLGYKDSYEIVGKSCHSIIRGGIKEVEHFLENSKKRTEKGLKIEPGDIGFYLIKKSRRKDIFAPILYVKPIYLHEEISRSGVYEPGMDKILFYRVKFDIKSLWQSAIDKVLNFFRKRRSNDLESELTLEIDY